MYINKKNNLVEPYSLSQNDSKLSRKGISKEFYTKSILETPNLNVKMNEVDLLIHILHLISGKHKLVIVSRKEMNSHLTNW